MLKRFKDNKVVDNWGTVRNITLKEAEWFDKIEKTEEETKGKNRILDPFKGWIEK